MPYLGLRILTAVLALGALALWVAHQLAPQLSVADALGWAAVWTVSVALVVALLAWALGSMGQWLLRHGARDSAWLWFRADPPGLQQPPRDRGLSENKHSSTQP